MGRTALAQARARIASVVPEYCFSCSNRYSVTARIVSGTGRMIVVEFHLSEGARRVITPNHPPKPAQSDQLWMALAKRFQSWHHERVIPAIQSAVQDVHGRVILAETVWLRAAKLFLEDARESDTRFVVYCHECSSKLLKIVALQPAAADRRARPPLAGRGAVEAFGSSAICGDDLVRMDGSAFAPGQHFQADACMTLLDKPEDFRRPARQIDDDAVGLKLWCRTSVQDPDPGRPTVRQVRDAKQCSERVAGVGRDHRVHVESDPASGYLAVDFLTVVGGQPFLGLENARRAPTWRSHRDPRGAA
jgi:hypothetical protein